MNVADHRIPRKSLRAAAISPFQGPPAALGSDSFDGVDVALRLVNNRGGVPGRELLWVVIDVNDPQLAAARTKQLINEQGVRLLIGCYGSDISIPVSKAAEENHAILWVQTAWTRAFFDHCPRYSFRTPTYAGLVEQTAVDHVMDTVAPRIGKAGTSPRVAVINESSGYGRSCAAETVTALAARGLEPVVRHAYEASSVEFTGLSKDLARNAVDVVFASSFPSDAVRLLNAIRSQAYRPAAVMTSSAGFGLYSLLAAGGDRVEGILTANAAAGVRVNTVTACPDGRQLHAEFITRLKAATGREPTRFNAMGFVTAYSLFHDILPRVENPEDPEQVRTAALDIDMPIDACPNGWGLKFDKHGQNDRSPACIDQWQDNTIVTIAPARLARSGLRDIPLANTTEPRSFVRERRGCFRLRWFALYVTATPKRTEQQKSHKGFRGVAVYDR